MTPEAFQTLITKVTDLIGTRSLDLDLEEDLNSRFPAVGEDFAAIAKACHEAIEAGWMCKHEQGGIRYGRVIKPGPDTHGLSVDVVEMDSIVGPHHRHPRGEIDMIIPQDPDARFDGRSAGWLVKAPGSEHAPTASNGRAVILYLLPGGEIEFTQ